MQFEKNLLTTHDEWLLNCLLWCIFIVLELGAKSFGYLTMTKDFELVEYGYRKYEPPPLSDHMKIVTRVCHLISG